MLPSYHTIRHSACLYVALVNDETNRTLPVRVVHPFTDGCFPNVLLCIQSSRQQLRMAEAEKQQRDQHPTSSNPEVGDLEHMLAVMSSKQYSANGINDVIQNSIRSY
jgi:hypothetical protein